MTHGEQQVATSHTCPSRANGTALRRVLARCHGDPPADEALEAAVSEARESALTEQERGSRSD
ncbi:hypothetical protein [Saccharomonospora iraqiensis]|uniref:hypothetical protein n=1 Tax=Saccharomonospora iraqiensis TaxID=52698 RepID=UPI00022E15AB|nr:hypothetical protein [Saccharomonospora iraqiensis]